MKTALRDEHLQTSPFHHQFQYFISTRSSTPTCAPIEKNTWEKQRIPYAPWDDCIIYLHFALDLWEKCRYGYLKSRWHKQSLYIWGLFILGPFTITYLKIGIGLRHLNFDLTFGASRNVAGDKVWCDIPPLPKTVPSTTKSLSIPKEAGEIVFQSHPFFLLVGVCLLQFGVETTKLLRGFSILFSTSPCLLSLEHVKIFKKDFWTVYLSPQISRVFLNFVISRRYNLALKTGSLCCVNIFSSFSMSHI